MDISSIYFNDNITSFYLSTQANWPLQKYSRANCAEKKESKKNKKNNKEMRKVLDQKMNSR